ncbi:hypothetical protein BS47DRAFT_1292211, partial [Hydnum rufescens UP504]
KQFPLWLAYSTTFNSCQGQTFDFIVLDGRSNVFSHGWLYTAISRVRCHNDTLLCISNEKLLTLCTITYSYHTLNCTQNPLMSQTLAWCQRPSMSTPCACSSDCPLLSPPFHSIPSLPPTLLFILTCLHLSMQPPAAATSHPLAYTQSML